MSFDYGERLEDGQFTRHPALPEKERTPNFYVLPLRTWVVHTGGATPCKIVTQLPRSVAETLAVKPTYYGRMFCCGCGAYLATSEFTWWDDGKSLCAAGL